MVVVVQHHGPMGSHAGASYYAFLSDVGCVIIDVLGSSSWLPSRNWEASFEVLAFGFCTLI